MKTADFNLPYYKQGDDLGQFLHESPEVALQLHINLLKKSIELLETLQNKIVGHNVSLDADCHCINVTGEVELINKLVEEGLLLEYDYDDYEDEDCEDGDE